MIKHGKSVINDRFDNLFRDAEMGMQMVFLAKAFAMAVDGSSRGMQLVKEIEERAQTTHRIVRAAPTAAVVAVRRERGD